jgi:hypothetical protein
MACITDEFVIPSTTHNNGIEPNPSSKHMSCCRSSVEVPKTVSVRWRESWNEPLWNCQRRSPRSLVLQAPMKDLSASTDLETTSSDNSPQRSGPSRLECQNRKSSVVEHGSTHIHKRAKRMGRPRNHWTPTRVRKLVRLYLLTSLDVCEIGSVLRADDFQPRHVHISNHHSIAKTLPVREMFSGSWKRLCKLDLT